ncbi:MAG TPA: hypothetical protein VE733_00415 [Streptosporangiaceae bacterium]|jgi:putative MFS transporter|nr:hypothetical protein [Streptosporangiaceae bacterium]
MSIDHLGTQAIMLIGTGVILIGVIVSVAWAPDTRDLNLAEAGSGDLATPAVPVSAVGDA